MSERLVVIGEIARAHGLRGEVRVTPLTDDPDRFERVRACVVWDTARDERQARRVQHARRQGDHVVLKLDGCESSEAAGALAGLLLAIPESEALPPGPGRFYPWQLEGARVVTENGVDVGRLTRIEPGPAHDLWVVQAAEREHLVPAVPDIVVDVDVAAGRVVIRPPDGLLDL